MTLQSSKQTVIFSYLTPLLAASIGACVYMLLTQTSRDTDSDFVFRLTTTAVAMTIPSVTALFLALKKRKHHTLGNIDKIGLAIALLSLVLVVIPIRGMLARARQAENLALSGVKAPSFNTLDINGKKHRLADHEGKVVLVNIWATWCPPCREEMPALEELYQTRKNNGLMIFGFSTEDIDTQKAFANEIVVSYPLLTTEGNVPDLYSQTARYPVNFLIDRTGHLQSAPSTDQPFENLVSAVDSLLQNNNY